jgi:hypothetical protein
MRTGSGASLQLDYQIFLYFEIMLNGALLHIKAAVPPVPTRPPFVETKDKRSHAAKISNLTVIYYLHLSFY